MPALVVMTTTPDLKTAKLLAKVLISNKVAACVSFREGFVSLYRWQEKVEETRETMLFIKTTRRSFSKAKNLIIKNHPYSVPEIIALPVSLVSPQYLSWLEKALQ